MNNFHILSQIFIETLKEFHINKQPLTRDSLCKALFAKQELSSILCEHDANSSLNLDSAPMDYSNLENSMSNRCCLHVTQVRNRLMEVLDICAILLDSDANTQSLNRIRKLISDSTSMDMIMSNVVDLLFLINALIDNTMSKINYTNEFLDELGKDLTQIENKLLSCHTYNNEMHSTNNDFGDGLLVHAKEMNQIFGANRGVEEIRRFILSKLSIIAESIEKKQEDDLKLQAAEERIYDLQNSVRTYSDEILQVRERANALEREILLDQLMGISNRRAYELQIRESFRRHNRYQESFALILMDVDNFKTVNDTYGHQVGDRCLRSLQKLSRSACVKLTF